jgi:hypothetical protein
VPTEVTAVVEGTLDKAVLARIADWVNVPVGIVHVKGGKSLIDRRLASYNEAARLSPWIVLRDLDQDADCAPALVSSRLPLPLLPPSATSATVGPAYNARLEEFAASGWRPRAAARRSPSLAGCIAALRELRGLPQGHRSR